MNSPPLSPARKDLYANAMHGINVFQLVMERSELNDRIEAAQLTAKRLFGSDDQRLICPDIRGPKAPAGLQDTLTAAPLTTATLTVPAESQGNQRQSIIIRTYAVDLGLRLFSLLVSL